jgi:hypothetical protein
MRVTSEPECQQQTPETVSLPRSGEITQRRMQEYPTTSGAGESFCHDSVSRACYTLEYSVSANSSPSLVVPI